MASTRLPGKVLADIGGKPMLVRVVERAGRARSIDALVVATTTDASDEAVAAHCAERGITCFRGHPTDVLDRFYRAGSGARAEVVVRLTADCPVIDPLVIDEVVSAFLAAEPPVDFATNRLPWERTYPIGLDTEVCTFEALEIAWREARQPHEREHVMPYLYEVPGRFRILHVKAPRDFGHLRWTVDTAEDLQLIRKVYAAFGGRDDFTWREVLDLFDREPSLAALNAGVRHKDYREAEG
jgi:spore coat polysaccharide biosynthesis protein SpsF